MSSRSSKLTYAATLLALAVAYTVTGKLGLTIGVATPSVTLIWPPTGITIAALVLLGRRYWPAITLGALATDVATVGLSAASVGMALGSTLEAVIAAHFLYRLGFRNQLDRVRDVLAFVVVSALACTLGATLGVASLYLEGQLGPWKLATVWRMWWLGDLGGALLVAPVLLLVTRPRLPADWRRRLELVALAVSSVILSAFVFYTELPPQARTGQVYLVLLPILWSALRFGPGATTRTMFLIAVIALWGTVAGRGPFVSEAPLQGMFVLQTFLGITAITALVVTASIAERRQAVEALAAAQQTFELRVTQRTHELTETNAALQRREAQLAEAQELSHVGSWEWDIRTDVVTWTDELYRIYGLEPHEFGASFAGFLDRLHPDDRDTVVANLTRARKEGSSFAFDERIIRPDGSVRILHSLGRVLVDDSGAPLRMLGSCQDITDRKAAETELRSARDALETRVEERTAELASVNEELSRAVRARDAFISVASHELRSPMSVLQLQVELLMHGAQTASEPARTRLETMSRQVSRVIKLLDNLLDASRIDAGQFQMQREEVDLTTVAREVADRFDLEVRRAGCTLAIRAGAPVVGRWDRVRIEQIVTNLLSNAIRYGAGAPIELFVEAHGGTGRLGVKDHGPGIAPGDQARIFERFERAAAKGRPATGPGGGLGLGLGLWIVNQIVHALEGTIHVHSEPGSGATFIVELPRQLALRAAQAAHSRVMLVEDDHDIRELLGDSLRSAGYEVTMASNGREALELLRDAPAPAVILLDMMMPVMDGREFLKERRDTPGLSAIPVVVISAAGPPSRPITELGAVDFLPKPVSLARLLSTIERYVVRT